MIKVKYDPKFELIENKVAGIGDIRIGHKLNIIVNYVCLEKTKSYIVLKINSAFLDSNKRKL